MTPLRDLLNEQSIYLRSYHEGEHRSTCPKCSHERKKATDQCLGVKIDDEGATWICHHCQWQGGVSDQEARSDHHARSKPQPVKPVVSWLGLDGGARRFFTRRKIGPAVLERNGVTQAMVWMPQLKRELRAIAFPYRRGGEIVNVKYRGPKKTFCQAKDAERIMYGLDDVENETTIIIVEGELDKLSLEEAGYTNVLSVPDGAPARVKDKVPDEEHDTGFDYLWNSRAWLDRADKIILATDADEPGRALSEELARRLGKARCWRVCWPSTNDVELKDANEVLVEQGVEVLRECVEFAEPYPITGLRSFAAAWGEILAEYEGKGVAAISTGWPGMDKIYRVLPGDVTVVTGTPGSGKSEWVDSLIVNLARDHGWHSAVCSMENTLVEHFQKLAEKYLGMPFHEAEYAGGRDRMGLGDLEAAAAWIEEHFCRIEIDGDVMPTMEWILDVARAAVMRRGIRGLVIDPYNELEHQRPDAQTETEYVSKMLSGLKRFARVSGVHVWFVAHPRQLRDYKGSAPGLYDISGSAHFVNKCDAGLVVHRNRDEEAGPLDIVEVVVKKVRKKVVGDLGTARFKYDRPTGRYEDFDEYEQGGLPYAAAGPP